MSEVTLTPRTDAVLTEIWNKPHDPDHYVPPKMIEHARQLERELSALSQEAVLDEALAIAEQDAGMPSWSVRVCGVRVARWTVGGFDCGIETYAKNFARAINAAATGIEAWGCSRQATGLGPCSNWCGSAKCPMTTALKREPNAAGEPHEYVDAPTGAIEEHGPTTPDVEEKWVFWEKSDGYAVGPRNVGALAVVFTWDEAVALCKAANALLAKLGQGWVPVSERLPEEHVEVLAYHQWWKHRPARRVRASWYKHSDGTECWQIETIAGHPNNVPPPSHWMPLPPAPGASDE